ncbi:vacuolar protein sorting-associated protein 26C isoform X4 [Physeter macrocephalus]|uniref:Vacuolar protein sorting-associated protein 26C isoform X4 n=1 Tax=Physeter macrocephalus TaxID=9755 RepID=A0A455BIA6_PHYMC|nr:vacuolar protein sorting-associated protein 26C isoform X4 [Physeter catodon]|eukprot:XP_028348467.1 Down syndrome critical region protein 3 isoform X3 [Physeter catodon]
MRLTTACLSTFRLRYEELTLRCPGGLSSRTLSTVASMASLPHVGRSSALAPAPSAVLPLQRAQRYTLRCDMRRSLLAKDLTKTCEFIVHSAPQKGKLTPSPVDFTVTPETLQNVKERALLPKFLIRGHLNSTNCVITQPLTGELVVESSEAAIKSIELQLVRVETCGCAEGYARDATEIQNIQIADGDVCRGLSVPIYMVFPRLFTCPTLETTNFKVGSICPPYTIQRHQGLECRVSACSHRDPPGHSLVPPPRVPPGVLPGHATHRVLKRVFFPEHTLQRDLSRGWLNLQMQNHSCGGTAE